MSFPSTIVEYNGQYAVIIPDELMKLLKWSVGDEVEMTLTPDKNIIVTRVKKEAASRI